MCFVASLQEPKVLLMDSLQFRISEKGKFKATVSFRKDRKLKHVIAVAGLKIL